MHAADPSVLAHCVAIVLARDERDGAALMRLAEQLRFGAILAHGATPPPSQFHHRLVFYLVHFDYDLAGKQKLLFDLRHAPSVSLSFAPVVLFLRQAADDEVLHNIELGFDDVITVPEDALVIGRRLAAQIGQEHLYIETRHYLGPDRHRLDHAAQRRPVRQALEEHAQLTIMRRPETGVHIVRRQVVHAGR